jgi:hypothetical protein
LVRIDSGENSSPTSLNSTLAIEVFSGENLNGYFDDMTRELGPKSSTADGVTIEN